MVHILVTRLLICTQQHPKRHWCSLVFKLVTSHSLWVPATPATVDTATCALPLTSGPSVVRGNEIGHVDLCRSIAYHLIAVRYPPHVV